MPSEEILNSLMTAEFFDPLDLSTLRARFICGAVLDVLEQDDVVGDVGHAELAEPRDPEQLHRLVGEHEADSEPGAALHERVEELAQAHGVGCGDDEVVEAVDDEPAGADLVDPVEQLVDELVDVDVDR